MASVIKIKKGLDINLKGRASAVPLNVQRSDTYAVCPEDFDGLVPKVVVKVGDRVKAGSVLITDKNHPEVKLVSPVCGEVVAINRGDKRKLLSVVVKVDGEMAYVDFGKRSVSSMNVSEIKEALLDGGVWPFIRQRPYDIVANPQDEPRDIFVSAFDSAPLAPDFNYIVKGEESYFQTGLDVLKRLTKGKVYLGIKAEAATPEVLLHAKGVEVVQFEGPHPAGNVGVQINHIAPVNKGEVVWVIRATDVLFIGRLFDKGIADFSRKVAVTGSETTERGYASVLMGASMRSILTGKFFEGKDLRFISGNVLTGKNVGLDGFLRAYDSQVTVIPEGDEVHELLGWAMPRCDQFSVSRTYFSWLCGKRDYCFDARIKGGRRAMIMSNEYDRVFPMDILPEYLIKAILAFNIDKMENLGIYEVAPEDFALCEFVDVSKLELQKIVRNGLDSLYKELN